MERESRRRTDPERILDLLWGRHAQPTRGPKPGLALQQIVAATIDIADHEGLAALSMRRIAERVGVTTMAMYRYVPGKTELLELMLDFVLGETGGRVGVTGEWRSRLTWRAREAAALYRRHPWALQLPVGNPPLGPNAIGLLEWVLEAVSGLGLDGGEMMDVVTAVTSYIRGQTEIILSVEQAAEQTGVACEAWGPAYVRLLERVADPTLHPTLTALVEHGDLEDPARVSDAAFEFGLQRILDGVEVLVRRRAAAAHG